MNECYTDSSESSMQNYMQDDDNFVFQQSTVWQNASRQSDEDDRATDMLLSIRGSEYFNERFDDKSSKKLILWQRISKELSDCGVPGLTDDIIGAKKCRQKFNNLVSQYQKFVAAQKQTGN